MSHQTQSDEFVTVVYKKTRNRQQQTQNKDIKNVSSKLTSKPTNQYASLQTPASNSTDRHTRRSRKRADLRSKQSEDKIHVDIKESDRQETINETVQNFADDEHSDHETSAVDVVQETNVNDTVKETSVVDVVQEPSVKDAVQDVTVNDVVQETNVKDVNDVVQDAAVNDVKTENVIEENNVLKNLHQYLTIYFSDIARLEEQITCNENKQNEISNKIQDLDALYS